MVKLLLPFMPPSTNNAFINFGTKGRGLSKDGKKFKNLVQAYVGQHYPTELASFQKAKNEPFTVFFRIHVAELENKTFGAKKGAESRYKKNDATNRIKLLEDVLADVTGIDDANTLTFVIQKVQAKDPAKEQVEVFIWNSLREESPFDEPVSRL